MFELHVSYHEETFNVISIRCINCKRETGLYLKNITFDEIITKIVLNAIYHHVGMSWTISPNKKMKYEIDKNNLQDWLNKGPWYNTSV